MMTSHIVNSSDLRKQVVEEIAGITKFVFTAGFQAVLTELRRLPARERAAFVESVLLSTEALRRRRVMVPDGLVIQRSVFADNRPSLFCVAKEIHGVLPWHKVTITFDNEGSMMAQ